MDLIITNRGEVQKPHVSKGDEIVSYLNQNLEFLFKDRNELTRKSYISRCRGFISFLNTNGFSFTVLDEYKKFMLESANIEYTTKSVYFHAAIKLVERLNHFRPDLLPDAVHQRMTKLLEAIPYPTEHILDGLLTDEINEVKKYLYEIEDGARRTRLVAMFVLMAFQGLRQFEVVKIHSRDLNLKTGRLRIQGKRNSYSNIFLYDSTIEALDNYVRFNDFKDCYLFPNLSPNAKPGKHITARSLRRIYTHILKELNIDCEVHGFRHWYVTQIAESTGSIFKVQRQARFRSIETAKKYIDTKETRDDLKQLQGTFKF